MIGDLLNATECASNRSQNRLFTFNAKCFRVAERDRTVCLLNAIEALSQLSYIPVRVD